MIRVTIELISAWDPSRDRVLGVAHIANVGENPDGTANYSVWLSKWAPKEKEAWKQGRAGLLHDELTQAHDMKTIQGFDKVHRGAWDLLYLCLRAVLGSRNTTPPASQRRPT